MVWSLFYQINNNYAFLFICMEDQFKLFYPKMVSILDVKVGIKIFFSPET